MNLPHGIFYVVGSLITFLCTFKVAAAYEDCNIYKLSESETTRDEYYRDCGNEYASCIRTMNIDNARHTKLEHDIYCRTQAAFDDLNYVGICPGTLKKVENSVIYTRSDLLKRIGIRNGFINNETGAVYKGADSYSKLKRLFREDPDDIDVVFALSYFPDDSLVTSLDDFEYRIQLIDLDPMCTMFWPPRSNSLASILSKLILEYEQANSNTYYQKKLLRKKITEGIDYYRDLILRAYNHYSDYKKLMTAFYYIDVDLFSSFTGIDEADDKKSRRAFLVKDLTTIYGSKSGVQLSLSLQLLCNDYAFEIGLVEACVELIVRDWDFIMGSGHNEHDGIYDAAMALAIATTRSCKDPHMMFSNMHIWPNDYCLNRYVQFVRSKLLNLLDKTPNLRTEMPAVMLRAYLEKNGDNTVNLFKRALQLDPKAIVHTLHISKRLVSNGFMEEAKQVIGLALRVAETHSINQLVFSGRHSKYNGFDELIWSEEYLAKPGEKNLEAVLETALMTINTYREIPFFETSQYTKRWSILWD